MGLDITAFSGLKEVRPRANQDDESGYEESFVSFYHNPDFPGRESGVKERVWYSYEESHGFKAGSYGGYNAWREQLAKLAGYPAIIATQEERAYSSPKPHSHGCWQSAGGPFYELINFADNEGVIGPEVAKKLAADFARFQPQADASGDAWFIDRYAHWRKAFEMASTNGAVHFH